MPRLIRSLRRCAGTMPARIAFRNAIILIAVGTTQLVVPGSQLQPYFVGSNFTSLSTFWNFQRQNQFASRPLLSISQQTPRRRWALHRPVVMRVNAARAVVHELCCSSPTTAGQPPSLACNLSRKTSVCSSSRPASRLRAIGRKQKGSTDCPDLRSQVAPNRLAANLEWRNGIILGLVIEITYPWLKVRSRRESPSWFWTQKMFSDLSAEQRYL